MSPRHPESLKDNFSSIKIVFLPKNTTSKTQPLDAGVIANWKVKYKKSCSDTYAVKSMGPAVRATL